MRHPALVGAGEVAGAVRGLIAERDALLRDREALVELRDSVAELCAAVARAVSGGRLSPRESELCAYLADRAGEAVAVDELLAALWGSTADARTLRVHVSLLRAKGVPIRTVHGRGYRLDAAPRQAPEIRLSLPTR